MPFQISPGVNVSEIDLTTIVPAVATTVGATAGVFSWGPVEDALMVSSETELVNVFGKPNANNFETFFSAANFLAYGNQLYVSRAAGAGNYNAIANASVSTTQIKNINDFDIQQETLSTVDTNYFYAKYPGSIGNTLKISVCPTATAYSSPIQSNTTSDVKISLALGSTTMSINCVGSSASARANAIANTITIGDYILIGNTTIGSQYVQVNNVADDTAGNLTLSLNTMQSLKTDWTYTVTGAANTAATRYWEFFNSVNAGPGTSNYVANRNSDSTIGDELHIVITDDMGVVTGIPGEILEVWPNLSRATDAKGEQGGTIFYMDVLKNNSQWVWPGKDQYGVAPAATLASTMEPFVKTYYFGGGGADDDEYDIAPSKIMTAFDQYQSAEDIDVSLIVAGKALGGAGEQIANYIIDNIVENRRDCVVFISPPVEATVNVPHQELNNVITFRNYLHSSSYAVLDSTAKYQYDKYNDVYRWVPMNGDIAGLCVRTDNIRDPWFSPAGFNRGNIKNVIKLAYNPNQGNRDQLYKNGVNPIVNFPGQGVVLYGDKTLLALPSAFDRINVRRLFIVLEKAIARAAKSSLFEFNDAFTQAAFRNLVEPYLRDIQGRRGIYDFRVICDSTNNTPEVVDGNRFVGDIYIKPARSINFIQLNFIAVRTGVTFDEVVGKF